MILSIQKPTCPFCRTAAFPPCCPACARALRPLLNGLCGRTPSCDYVGALFVYSDLVQQAIHRYKFGGHREYAESFALLLNECALPAADLVVPVPTADKAKPYDTSRLLARELSRLRGMRFCSRAVRKIRPTPKQHALPLPKRYVNLNGCFEAAEKRVRGRRILIIDDIVTTGTTVNQLAAALKRAGAAEVYAFALAASGIAFRQPLIQSLQKFPDMI